MDADGSHRPEDLGRLLEASDDGADLVLGSRWVPGGGVVNWPWYRRLISRGGTFYAQLMLGIPIKDATGGYRAFRRETLERLPLDEVASQGYCFQIDMARRVLDAGMTIVEVPITFVERVRGESKMSGAHRARGPVAGHRVGLPAPRAQALRATPDDEDPDRWSGSCT